MLLCLHMCSITFKTFLRWICSVHIMLLNSKLILIWLVWLFCKLCVWMIACFSTQVSVYVIVFIILSGHTIKIAWASSVYLSSLWPVLLHPQFFNFSLLLYSHCILLPTARWSRTMVHLCALITSWYSFSKTVLFTDNGAKTHDNNMKFNNHSV